MTDVSGDNAEKRPRILLVDDKAENLSLLIRILSTQNYIVNPAISGETALKFLQTILPDLILLDVMMPDINGYEMCRRLQADERTRKIPVIFISAGDCGEASLNKAKALFYGGVDYITKPFQAEEILMRVQMHLSHHDQQS